MIPPPAELAILEEQIRCRLMGRLYDFQLLAADQGVVLRGRSRTYHAKQLAQEAVLERPGTRIQANEIEVS